MTYRHDVYDLGWPGKAKIATQAGSLSVWMIGFFMPPETGTYWVPSSM